MDRRALLALAVVLAPTLAHAERDPWQAGAVPHSFARPDGRVRVHYVTTTADARRSTASAT